MNHKKNKLDKYNFSTKEGFNSILLKLRYKYLSKFFNGESCLELGCADGEGTKLLIKYFKSITAVDGSEKLINRAKDEIHSKKVNFITSFFEDLTINEKFDTVVLAHILEHVDNPILTIKTASRFLKDNGVVIIDVPNANSIHRQIGVLIKMIRSKYQLNEADKSIGHRRVYDMEMLLKDVRLSGLVVRENGGIFLKPLSNVQMEVILSKKGIEAFSLLGTKYPEIAAEIYVICTKNRSKKI